MPVLGLLEVTPPCGSAAVWMDKALQNQRPGFNPLSKDIPGTPDTNMTHSTYPSTGYPHTYSADWEGLHPLVWFSTGAGALCICNQSRSPMEEKQG